MEQKLTDEESLKRVKEIGTGDARSTTTQSNLQVRQSFATNPIGGSEPGGELDTLRTDAESNVQWALNESSRSEANEKLNDDDRHALQPNTEPPQCYCSYHLRKKLLRHSTADYPGSKAYEIEASEEGDSSRAWSFIGQPWSPIDEDHENDGSTLGISSPVQAEQTRRIKLRIERLESEIKALNVSVSRHVAQRADFNVYNKAELAALPAISPSAEHQG